MDIKRILRAIGIFLAIIITMLLLFCILAFLVQRPKLIFIGLFAGMFYCCYLMAGDRG